MMPPIEGSSPLTRGKHMRRLEAPTADRLIPAHAGKTDGNGSIRALSAAHPRSRGENCAVVHECVHPCGSSPLTRGKQDSPQGPGRPERLIPAHAGKTARGLAVYGLIAAHPRSRGENVARQLHGGLHVGSSPLTRGKPPVNDVPLAARRLIPAHAGKT